MSRVENYGKTWSFSPRAVVHPRSAGEIRDIVRRARKVRVMGSRHSWSKGIVTDDTLVSLDAMNQVVRVDRQELRVTVQAGIRLKELIAELERVGLALRNLGSIDLQSLAGAIGTGTHGSGIGFQCLASQVESLDLIDGSGRARHLERGDPDFNAVVVGLGCFGIIHQMTLSVVPSFQLHAITDTARFDEVIENLDEYVRGFDHFKFWWLVPGETVIVFKHQQTQAPRDDSDLTRWFKDELLSVIVYRSLVALQGLDRKRLVPLVNDLLGREVGKRFERTCKSHVGFLTPVPPVHRETEWAFDYEDARSLLKEYRDLLRGGGHTYNFVQEIRFTGADDFWLSPAYGRDTIWLSMYNMDRPERWDDQLNRFEAFATKHGGRPHWGKEASFPPGYLTEQWPRLPEFRDLVRQYDPTGKFANDWALRVLSG